MRAAVVHMVASGGEFQPCPLSALLEELAVVGDDAVSCQRPLALRQASPR